MVKVLVTDHALLRYIERRFGVPIDKIRDDIEKLAYPAARAGATYFQIENVKFVLAQEGARPGYVTIKTTMERHWKAPRGGQRRMKKNRQLELEP